MAAKFGKKRGGNTHQKNYLFKIGFQFVKWFILQIKSCVLIVKLAKKSEWTLS